MERGNLGHFLDWWVVLRSLIDGVPIRARRIHRVSRSATCGALDLHR